jgi:predicted membrane-bound spermidine synthase
VVLAIPPLILGTRLPRDKGVWGFLLFFVFIGIGYILIEVALIQKFVLFLGHPTYALTVVIFSMLVSSGYGSYFSRRLVASADNRLVIVLAGIASLVGILSVALSSVLSSGVGWPFWVKILVTVLLIFPAGFLMGIPFPSGIRRLEKRHHASVRWAWSLNAASSVLGSVSAMVLAIYLGLMQTLVVGGVLYLCALLLVRKTPR